MIVKCDKCQTRFKIPDEKVTEKGVKVRCTRCQHTFRVARARTAGEASGAPSAYGAGPGGGLAPPVGGMPPPAVDTDPFASFGIAAQSNEGESTRPGYWAAGVAATLPTSPGTAVPKGAVLGAHAGLPREVFDSPTAVGIATKHLLDGILPATASGAVSGSVPWGQPPASLPPAAPAFDPSDPFAGIEVDSAPRPLSDFEPTSPVVPTFRPPPEAFTSAPEADPFSLLDDSPAPVPPRRAPPPADAPAPPASDLLGALPPPDEDDPFGSLAFGEEKSGDPDRGLFDMSHAGLANGAAAAAQGLSEAAGPPRSFTPVGQLSAPKPAVAHPERPEGRPEEVGIRETAPPPGPVRRVAGLVVNLAVASVLLVAILWVGSIYVNEGRVDSAGLSLAPLQALFSAPAELRAVDVSNGLYDTRSGRPLFYVRGEVENRGREAATVKVRVDIVDGALRVGSAEALAGHDITPEELWAVSSPAQLAELKAKARPEAAVLAPGARAPFLLAFYDYPPELSQYRLKVTVERIPDAKH